MPRKNLGRAAQRRGAVVSVTVTYSCSRYERGEFVIRTTYRFDDGRVEHDPNRRIYLARGTELVIRELWTELFDATALGQQCAPRTIAVRLELEGAPVLWHARMRAVAEIVAHELRVVVRGTVADTLAEERSGSGS
jgi:hypothetical protein